MRLSIACIILAASAFAQTAGVQGRITEATAVAVPNAAVKLTNLDTASF